jgi:hypothetical protein
VIKCPRKPGRFSKRPEGVTSRGLRGHLITNFPQSVRLVCKYMVAEGIERGVLPVLNAV